MRAGHGGNGLLDRLGKAILADALGGITAVRKAAKVPVKGRAAPHPGRQRRVPAAVRAAQGHRGTEDPFLARPPVPCNPPDRGR